MPTPFQLVWTDASDNVLSVSSFPIGFPNTISTFQQLKVKSNADVLQTYETLTGVKLFLTGTPAHIDAVQNTWPFYGGSTRPELNGGLDISFDFGRTYTRFDTTHGLESNPSTWITLPVEAIGQSGAEGTLGAFDVAHLTIRYTVPPDANQFEVLDIRLALDFDII